VRRQQDANRDAVRQIKRIVRIVAFALLVAIALASIAVALPRWSVYLASLQFSGIGVSMDQEPGQPVIVEIVPGTPAAHAGLQKGDIFLKVNGEDVGGLAPSEVADRVGGPEGSRVNLVILRGNDELAFSLTRSRYVTPDRGAAALGVSPLLGGAILLASSVIGAAVSLATALLLFSRRASAPFVFVLALAGLYMASWVVTNPVLSDTSEQGGFLVVDTALWTVLGMAVLYRFPDGRYVPRTTAVGLALVAALQAVRIAEFYAGSRAFADARRLGELGLLASAVLAQAYRYRSVSTATQRQQTKWFVLGAFSLIVAAASTSLVPLVVPRVRVAETAEAYAFDVLATSAWGVASAIVALSVAFGVLKYRLFEVDLIINRAVLYGSVTVLLLGTFVGSGVLLQAVLGGSPLGHDSATILAAVAVAALFGPLRRRVRTLVDHVLPAREKLTLLFTDIVGSTERTAAIGDAAWRELLDAYRAGVRRQLKRFRGEEIDTAGDGFFATFRLVRGAAHCAFAINQELERLHLRGRTGVHFGECEMRGEKPTGVNVVVAARLMALAAPGEVLASSLVRDLVGRSDDLSVADRGDHTLKGVPGVWQVYALSARVAEKA
jgi:class 3 adenylate cyclase